MQRTSLVPQELESRFQISLEGKNTMEAPTVQYKLSNKDSVGSNEYYINMADQANLRKADTLIISVCLSLPSI